MNTAKHRFRLTVLTLTLLLSTLNAQLSKVLAQGPLTPPGAPAPTMKTLDQVEARKPIAGPGAVTISTSGSYYLTTNIAVTAGNAITITADNVTLDLNGFTLSSTEASPSGTGILLSGGRAHVHILNGHIKGNVTGGGVYSGSGFAYGIYASGTAPRNVHVTGVSVSGCLLDGINLGFDGSTVVESCNVQTVGGHGIAAGHASHSTAKECGLNGIGADTVSDCRGESTGVAYGVFATNAQNCHGTSNSGTGVIAGTAQNCTGQSFGNGNGVSATVAQNCYGTSGGSGNGVSATTAGNCYGTSDTGIGVSVAYIANNCYGNSGAGTGLDARSATNCYGTSDTGPGLNAVNAANCYGASGSSDPNNRGLSANAANNCIGFSFGGTGVYAVRLATSCSGSSGSAAGKGLYCVGTAAFCTGENNGGGIAIQSNVGIGCVKLGGTNNITSPFLGTVSP